MRWFAKPDHAVAALLFVLSMTVYAMTASPTISFWDCAEFIATAHTLGIPHQPGTPLYVLVGHVFSMLPLGLGVAHKVNLMSGFFSAGRGVLHVPHCGAHACDLGGSRRRGDPWMDCAVGRRLRSTLPRLLDYILDQRHRGRGLRALGLHRCRLSPISLCAGTKCATRPASATLMLLIVYLMGMSIGFHLGSVLVFPGVFMMVLAGAGQGAQDSRPAPGWAGHCRLRLFDDEDAGFPRCGHRAGRGPGLRYGEARPGARMMKSSRIATSR